MRIDRNASRASGRDGGCTATLIEAALKIGLPDGMRQLVIDKLGTVQARLDRRTWIAGVLQPHLDVAP